MLLEITRYQLVPTAATAAAAASTEAEAHSDTDTGLVSECAPSGQDGWYHITR